MTTWKRVERDVAKRVGGERVPVSGRQRGDAPDIRHEHLSLEVKHRKALPAWMHDAMRQAEASAKPGQLPMAVFHGERMRVDQSFVMVRLSDWVEWYGDVT